MTHDSDERASKERALCRNKVANILSKISAEVARATAKHPSMCSAHHGYAVIKEELDELWDEIKADRGTFDSARKEAIQIAATAVRYLLDVCGDEIPF